MNISIEQYRAAVGGFNILKCVSKGLYYYTVPDVKFNCVYFYTGLIIFMLLIISVDIHVHPGPVYKTTYLGLCHANVRSLVSDRSKLDDLKYIADSILTIFLIASWQYQVFSQSYARIVKSVVVGVLLYIAEILWQYL